MSTLEQSMMTVIGRAEKIALPTIGAKDVPAKVDTGADSSSIWAHISKVEEDNLKVVFFGPDTPFYDGREHRFGPEEFEITVIENSFGHSELRYKVKLKVTVKGRTINGTFTLADRSNKLYPILIGRALLTKKFLVDVSQGSPLKRQERERTDSRHEKIINIKEITTKELPL